MSDISPELVKRMVALVRFVAEHSAEGYSFSGIGPETRAIAALLPIPVDPDLIEARKMVAEQAGMNYPQYYLSGGRDDWSNVQLALSAIKRGRELAESGK